MKFRIYNFSLSKDGFIYTIRQYKTPWVHSFPLALLSYLVCRHFFPCLFPAFLHSCPFSKQQQTDIQVESRPFRSFFINMRICVVTAGPQVACALNGVREMRYRDLRDVLIIFFFLAGIFLDLNEVCILTSNRFIYLHVRLTHYWKKENIFSAFENN